VGSSATPRGLLPGSYFNLGNSLFRKQRYPEAVEAYKRCLLLDPSEEDCRHNLVLALRPPQSCNKDNKDPSKGGGGNDDKDKKPASPKQQPPSGGDQEQQKGMSKEDAERILRMVHEKEKDAQSKMEHAQQKPSESRRTGEDW